MLISTLAACFFNYKAEIKHYVIYTNKISPAHKKASITNKYSINKGGKLMKKVKSGENAPKSGTYKVVDSKGKTQYTVNVDKGDRMPPTQSSGNHFEID